MVDGAVDGMGGGPAAAAAPATAPVWLSQGLATLVHRFPQIDARGGAAGKGAGEGADEGVAPDACDVDLVIGNWLQPPEELHLGRLLSDEVVCLVAQDHPATRRNWTVEKYLDAEHVAPMPMSPGALGVIDEHLRNSGVQRRIMVRASHFSLIPLMVADSLLVLTTGRQFCSRYVGTLPVKIVRCPASFPALNYYQLWHELSHAAPSMRWFREQVREVASGLTRPAGSAGSTFVERAA